MSQVDVAEQIRALEAMNIHALREQWRARYGEPPPLRSTDLVRRLLAWRIQAEVLGGLSPETRRALARKQPQPRGPTLHPGARVAREWQGVRYEVEATEDGFAYNGRTFASLSEVAREITGVRWNGPRFFGLRSEPAR